jgi:hypothetical protein
MPDPLTVEQIELRSIIRELEQEYRNLHDANAQVSIDGLNRLALLTEKLDAIQSAHSVEVARKFTRDVFVALAAEAVRWLVEISIRVVIAAKAIWGNIYARCGPGNSRSAADCRCVSDSIGGRGGHFLLASLVN